MNFMIAFGLASIMLTIGLIIRTKVGLIRNMLVPASVIGGIIGLIVMNTGLITAVESDMFIQIVTLLFTVTFISVGLTSNPRSKNTASDGKTVARGAVGMGFTWNILYALAPAVGVVILFLIGGYFGMDYVYGLLIPFAFAQGPGQAATFGAIMDNQYGIADAATIGLTFAAIGFILCFLVGVPLARYGIKKGLAKNMESRNIEGSVIRGYYKDEEERPSLGKETMYSGNLDTMTFHFAIIGICFMLALGLAELFSYIPGIGPTISGMLFIFGMVAGYLVKFIMKKLKVEHMLNNTFQSKITGWSTDYLIVASFMGVPFSVIGAWIVPISIMSIIVMLLSLGICIYFGQRFGAGNDFERTLGLYGTSMGTVPSGIALVRIVDPSLRSPTAVELGLMNLPMMTSYVTLATIMAIASGALSLWTGVLLLLAPIPVYLLVMKISRAWGPKTYMIKTEHSKELNNVGSAHQNF
ncbi:sodium/glutamate symporter [Salinicoccus roseus]|uniref:sodium/glutamate symporter n=1 Tax=Salinicoccus roseus TaxID=45670 RepID=UPI000FB3FE24|nr:sodium/glutamate symporter [Salinicoccus roseus]RPE54757.1 ESS family glutamate:Na+ symporter [Salinicoccus roseus]GGA62878.1 sodium:glutamate symporter [Salinicoccus roseus]